MTVTSQGPVPILYVHYGTDWIRGSERVVLDLLNAVDRARFQPFLWCNTPALGEAARASGVTVTLGRFPILLDWAPPRFDVRGFAGLVREGTEMVRRDGIRLVHANSGAPCQWMIPVARHTKRPLLAHLHASYNLRGRCIFGLHHATLVAGVSRPTLQGLADDGVPRERLRLVHNGIDFARLSRGDASGLRKSLGIGPNDLVLCSIGSLIHRKGFDVLLRAFARLRREEPHLHLLVVGGGPEHEALVALSRELGLEGAAHFLGEREDPGPILRDAVDIAVSASRDEGLALFVMEALSFGRPVVATNVGGTAEALEDGITGYLAAPEDATGLADLVLRLVHDPALRKRLGDAARERSEEFRVQRMVERFAALYDELLAIPSSNLGWSAPRGPFWPYLRLAGGILGRRLRRGLPTA